VFDSFVSGMILVDEELPAAVPDPRVEARSTIEQVPFPQRLRGLLYESIGLLSQMQENSSEFPGKSRAVQGLKPARRKTRDRKVLVDREALFSTGPASGASRDLQEKS
jgi:hypothetical protein